MSDFEAHPISAIEALTVGLEVVVSDDRAGLRELAMKGLATLVQQRASPQQIASAILTAADRNRAVASVTMSTWDDCAREVFGLYQSVIRQSQKGDSCELLPRLNQQVTE
jgi:hypothetical protein